MYQPHRPILLACCLLLLLKNLYAQQPRFTIAAPNTRTTIFYDAGAPKLDSIAAHLLAADVERVSGYRPQVSTRWSAARGNVIIIGAIDAAPVQRMLGRHAARLQALKGRWECFGYTVVDRPIPQVTRALVIAGSDKRGTAYGVFALSEKLGVSPWYWWADAPVRKQPVLSVVQPTYISAPPSVRYRGIFINDEDWGLRTWAANTFEPEQQNIGPKTYAKVFELLLRLKANLLWPAMHPGTAPFYSIRENVRTAADWGIVVGSSHAEPMLRNNVGEWDEKTMGRFNYLTNKERVYAYWEQRLQQANGTDVVYSLGMRGVHDSGIEGVKTAGEAVPLLERIIGDQRALISRYAKDSIQAVPQAFTAYKEVLDIYDQGLRLPDDVTLVWPDDNYGYIQRLNNDTEQGRKGGSGVYYHASYWGRPHDYLWLGTTHPSLIRQEMMKALVTGADRMWVLNVGDIKPIEYNMQLFFDMAYHAAPFRNSTYPRQHLQDWVAGLFGAKAAPQITATLWQFYRMAFERRPEFMGWSQTEPTTQTRVTAYHHFSYGDQAQKRIDACNQLQVAVKQLTKEVPPESADAFYQLVYYPVTGAALMNKKFLYRDKALLYAKQQRLSATGYARLAQAAYDSIVAETAFYNNVLKKGKWKGMMSMQPRDLPVFNAPALPATSAKGSHQWDAVPEGYDTLAYNRQAPKVLPRFTAGVSESYFIDLFLTDTGRVAWEARAAADWIRVSQVKGILQDGIAQNTYRLWVKIDAAKLPAAGHHESSIRLSGGGRTVTVNVQAYLPETPAFHAYRGFVEANGIVSMQAQHFATKRSGSNSDWILSADAGHNDAALLATLPPGTLPDTATLAATAGVAVYPFWSLSGLPPAVSIYTLPTHPLNKQYSMRYAVQIDNGPIRIVNFKTVGRSEEWKENVLRNSAVRNLAFPELAPGRHELKLYAIDPGVVPTHIRIDFGSRQKGYGMLPETRKE